MNKSLKILAIAGGVGAAKLLKGFYKVMDPSNLNVIINTGDDAYFFGLRICPDIDIILYTLAEIINTKHNWGIADDTFTTLNALKRFYGEQWFSLGDNDLATHIFRSHLLQKGENLFEITQKIADKLQIKAHIYPMADGFYPTIVETELGTMDFQEYFVKHRFQPKIIKLHYSSRKATLYSQFYQLFKESHKIIICPSNPWLSIEPIFQIPGFYNLMKQNKEKIYAISPIVAGQALKGPTRQIMEGFGVNPSCLSIGTHYQEIISTFIIDTLDKQFQSQIHSLGINCLTTNIIMKNEIQKKTLAQFIIDN